MYRTTSIGIRRRLCIGLIALGLPTMAISQVIRGPYLQLGTPTRVNVKWRTATSTDSVVHYGTELGNLTSTAFNSRKTTEHEVILKGLKPNTTYYYNVGDSNRVLTGGDRNHFYKTPPRPGPALATRIWVLGDSGFANANVAQVRDAFYTFNGSPSPDLLLMLGDNAYQDGTDEEYQQAVFNVFPGTLKNTVLWPTLGNHDGRSADSGAQSGTYYDIFSLPRSGEAGGLSSGTEAYYSFDYGNIHFICLDSYDSNRASKGPMLSWLKNDLKATAQKWIIAFWHHPPYTKGAHNSDSSTDSKGRMRDMRQRALPILENAGVDLVLSGHSHNYERSFLINKHYGVSSTFRNSMKVDGGDGKPNGDGAYDKTRKNGAVYVVAGTASDLRTGPLNHPAMFVSLSTLGSLVLDVEGNKLEAKFIDHVASSPNLIDEFTIIKGDPEPLLAERFIAYNDLSWTPPQKDGNITRYTTVSGSGDPPDGDSGFLIDYETGLLTDVRLSVTGGDWNGTSHTEVGSIVGLDTDAVAEFQGIVDLEGIISYGSSDIELTFSGLDPFKSYELVAFGNRGKSLYSKQLSKTTLLGATSFSNESSVGSLFSSPLDNTTVIDSGFNTLNGYISRFTNIDPGTNGVVTLVQSDGGSVEAPRFYANAICLEEIAPAPVSQVTSNQIVRDFDDAEEVLSTGKVKLQGLDLDLGVNGLKPQLIGLRFASIMVPREATIEEAYIQFTTDDVGTNSSLFTVSAEAADHAPRFEEQPFYLSSRITTTATVPWQPLPWASGGAQGLEQRTPNLATILQEIIDRDGWELGNALALLIQGTGARTALSREANSQAAPQLHITFSSHTVVTEISITTSSDDAEESLTDNNVTLNSSDLELTKDRRTAQLVGLRFPDLRIPRAAMIQKAYIQFTADEVSNESTSLTIESELVEDAPSFEGVSGNISSRSRTSASVAWTPVAWPTPFDATMIHRTPDLTSIVQEIVDQANWSEGGALAFIVGGTGRRTAESADKAEGTGPKLIIEYLPAEPELRTVVSYNDLSWAPGQMIDNITRYTTDAGLGNPPETSQGLLLDYATGERLPISLSIQGGVWDGAVHAARGALSIEDTDAYIRFKDRVDTTGIISFDKTDLKMTFSGLNPAYKYNLSLFGNHANVQATPRLSKTTLSGAQSFENTSSISSTVTGANQESTIIDNGFNTRKGQVARFTNIFSGEDGEIKLTQSDGGSHNPSKPYINAVKFSVRSTPSSKNVIIGEVGVVTFSQPNRTTWFKQTLMHTYKNPVVVMQPLSFTGDQSTHMRIRNVRSSSFEYKMEEWRYLGGAHIAETVHYLVMESGEYTLTNGTKIKVGKRPLGTRFSDVVFPSRFDKIPVVLCMTQTENEADPIVVHMENATRTKFRARLREEQAGGRIGNGSSHTPEILGYVAIEPSSGKTDNITFEAGLTPRVVDEKGFELSFAQTFSSVPAFLARTNTEFAQDPHQIRYFDLDRRGVSMIIQEEKSADSELVRESKESIGYLAIHPLGPDPNRFSTS